MMVATIARVDQVRFAHYIAGKRNGRTRDSAHRTRCRTRCRPSSCVAGRRCRTSRARWPGCRRRPRPRCQRNGLGRNRPERLTAVFRTGRRRPRRSDRRARTSRRRRHPQFRCRVRRRRLDGAGHRLRAGPDRRDVPEAPPRRPPPWLGLRLSTPAGDTLPFQSVRRPAAGSHPMSAPEKTRA